MYSRPQPPDSYAMDDWQSRLHEPGATLPSPVKQKPRESFARIMLLSYALFALIFGLLVTGHASGLW